MATPRLYKDSKTFVDKPLKTSPDNVLKNFDEFMKVCITKHILLNYSLAKTFLKLKASTQKIFIRLSLYVTCFNDFLEIKFFSDN